MDTSDNAPAVTIAPGTVPMARIDGSGIRRLRESKGLTQLYLATYIGVTTDTISRWENRRYPSIKLDNAEKLAQALEVDLEAILDHEARAPQSTMEDQDAETIPVAPSMATSPPPDQAERSSSLSTPHGRPLLFWLLPVVVLLMLVGLARWRINKPAPPAMAVAAQRILPDHAPAGQTFPVLIRVTTSQQAPVALILKESIPPGCVVVDSEPPLTTVAAKKGVLKWVSRTDRQQTLFTYLLRTPSKSSDGDRLSFNGGVTLNQSEQTQAEIGGGTAMTIAPYHWADVNQDNTIDDEEILAVYDQYSALSKLDFGRDLIDSIWASSGYSWNRKSGKYVEEK